MRSPHDPAPSLTSIFEGWDGHQLALVRAIIPLTPEQLAWRPAPQLRSVGQLISHIALARLYWFHNMGAPGSAELARQIAPWEGGKANTENLTEFRRWFDAIAQLEDAIVENPTELLRWLESSWQMIETTLTTWTVADLAQSAGRALRIPLMEVRWEALLVLEAPRVHAEQRTALWFPSLE